MINGEKSRPRDRVVIDGLTRRWKLLVVSVLSGIALLVCGVFLGGMLRGREPHAVSREKAILSQASQRSFGSLLIGDSFVELADLPQLCGTSALNAGVSGARTADARRLALPLITSLKPKFVLINIGVNDANLGARSTLENIRLDLRSLIDASKHVGAVVIIMAPSLPPSAFHKGFDRQRFLQIVGVERALGAAPVPSLSSMDGVHPDASGYRVWKAIAASQC